MFSSGGGGGMGGGFGEDLSRFMGGLFGDSSRPYKDAMDQYREWASKGEGAQNPFLDFGKRGMPAYEEWIKGMKDPSGFINNLMGKYSESPWAKFQQEQALRASGNQGSAAGLGGSTPMAQFNQQNARDISSQDMGSWLQKVLGINTEYGHGLNNQIGYGQHAADQLTSMYGDMGRQMAEAAYGKRRGQSMDRSNLWGGWLGMGADVGKSLFGGGGL